MRDPHDAAADFTARQLVATALAAALSDACVPPDRGLPSGALAALGSAWRLLVESHASLKRTDLQHGELLPTDVEIEAVERWLRLDPERRQRAAQCVFGLVISSQCPPCETEFLRSKDAFCRAQVMADITGFYRAFGVEVSSRHPQRPDHLVLELEFVALLLEKLADAAGDRGASERMDVCQRALASFMKDHLTTWVASLGRLVAQRAADAAATMSEETEREGVALLGGVGRILCAWVAAERHCARLEPALNIELSQLSAPIESDQACAACECL